MTDRRDLFHVFRHGLGDAVQFTAVLAHLEAQRPAYRNIVLAPSPVHRLFADSMPLPEKPEEVSALIQYERLRRTGLLVVSHGWEECPTAFAYSPSTKAVWCIKNGFGDLKLDPALLRYRVPHLSTDAARRFLADVPRPFAVVHFAGYTSTEQKNMSPAEGERVCRLLVENGIAVVVLHWQDSLPFASQRNVFWPGPVHSLWENGRADPRVLAAIMQQAAVTVCIDSGPGKVALAVDTPAVQVWRQMHPIHYCDMTQHAVHLVPVYHEKRIRGDRKQGMAYFEANYRHKKYTQDKLPEAVAMEAIAEVFRGPKL